MREKGILFQAPLVRALLAGTKTQTRRIVKPQPTRSLPHTKTIQAPGFEPVDVHHPLGWRWKTSFWADTVGGVEKNGPYHCPYGVPGDRLWVRETWATLTGNGIRTVYRADGEDPRTGWDDMPPERRPPMRWRPSIFMPRAASRITLEVTEVRVQRLQDISEEDAKAEGVRSCDRCDGSGVDPVRVGGVDPEWCSTCGGGAQGVTCRDEFERLWDVINGAKAPWSSNPFVWAISFRRLP